MKNLRKTISLLLVMLVVSIFDLSCRKEEFLDLLPPDQFQAVPWTVISNTGPIIDNGISCTQQTVKWGPQYTEVNSLNPQGDVIYPGGMLKYESFQNGSYTPIVGNRKPLTISASLSRINGNGTKRIEEPSLSSVREGMRQILVEKANGGTAAEVFWSSRQIYSKKHFELAVGGNYGTWFTDISASYEYESNSVIGRYLLEFEQVYYSIDVDIPPPGLENWFEQAPNAGQLGEYSPVYVSSVKYGRKVFLLIESKTISYGHKAEIEASFNGFVTSGGFTVDSYLSKLITEKSIKAFIMGGPSAQAIGVISNAGALRNYLTAGSNYSESSPGVPLSYTMRFVKDNSIATLNRYDEFEVRECDLVSNIEPVVNIPNKGNLAPDWIGGGDREFHGNGPNMQTKCVLNISSDKKKLYLNISFTAKETKSNWTEGNRTWIFTIFDAPIGKVIDSIISDKVTEWNKTDTNGFAQEKKTYSSTELVKEIVTMGDTEGNDLLTDPSQAGELNKTRIVRIIFNPVHLKLKNG